MNWYLKKFAARSVHDIRGDIVNSITLTVGGDWKVVFEDRPSEQKELAYQYRLDLALLGSGLRRPADQYYVMTKAYVDRREDLKGADLHQKIMLAKEQHLQKLFNRLIKRSPFQGYDPINGHPLLSFDFFVVFRHYIKIEVHSKN